MIEKDFSLDSWHVEVARGRITRAQKTIRLEPQIMKVLVYLAEHHNEVVSKDTLMSELWRNAFVSDAALTRCIFEIRQAFGDDPKHPRIVETVPKVGYRLIARLAPAPTEKSRAWLKALWPAAAALAIAGFMFIGDQEAEPESLSNNAVALDAYKKGVVHFEEYDYLHNENAIALFEKAIASDPSFGLAYARLAGALVHQELYYGGDRTVDARTAANKALKLEPSSPRSHNANGLVLSLLGQDADALSAFEQANGLDPTHWQSTFNAATIYKKNLDFRTAESLFLQTIEHYPNHVLAMEHLGFLYIRMGDVENAKHWLNRAQQVAPMTAYAASQLATLALVSGETITAIENCEMVRRYQPKHMACLHVLGVSNLLDGDMEEASKWFEYTSENFSERRYADLGRAQIFLAGGETEAGMAIIDEVLAEAIDNVPDDYGSWQQYWLIAACYALQGNNAQAFEWLEKAAVGGRRFYLWDAADPVFANLRGDQRFDRYIAMTMAAGR